MMLDRVLVQARVGLIIQNDYTDLNNGSGIVLSRLTSLSREIYPESRALLLTYDVKFGARRLVAVLHSLSMQMNGCASLREASIWSLQGNMH